MIGRRMGKLVVSAVLTWGRGQIVIIRQVDVKVARARTDVRMIRKIDWAVDSRRFFIPLFAAASRNQS
jgi:hypothetical protein